MKYERMIKVLVRLRRLHNLLGRGEVFTLSDVAQAAHMPRSTTYRYLRKLVELGHVDLTAKMYRGSYANHYSLSMRGYEFLKQEGE